MDILFHSLWNVMSIEEAVAEVRSLPSPVLAAKRLQDLAQGYGCNENLSIMVLRFHNFSLNQDLIREIKFSTMSNKIKVSTFQCQCKTFFAVELLVTYQLIVLFVLIIPFLFYSQENDAFCLCDQNRIVRSGTIISEEDRSSPSGQSDKFSGSRYSQSAGSDGSRVKNYVSYKHTNIHFNFVGFFFSPIYILHLNGIRFFHFS